jgi:hypothetical protein
VSATARRGYDRYGSAQQIRLFDIRYSFGTLDASTTPFLLSRPAVQLRLLSMVIVSTLLFAGAASADMTCFYVHARNVSGASITTAAAIAKSFPSMT